MPSKNNKFKNINIEENLQNITLDDMINKWHDPDLVYFYIKQMKKNIEEGINIEDIPDNKKLLVSTYNKLEVFRASMQYLEEFGIYFLSYIDNPKEIIQNLVNTWPRDVKCFFEKIKKGNYDKFSSDKGYTNYRDLLKKIFGYDLIPKLKLDTEKFTEKEISKKIEDSLDFLQKKIDHFAEYYLTYLDLYNSIKHGTRIFPHKISSIGITGSKNFKAVLSIDYVIAICKDERGKVYFPAFPIDYLFDNSLRIVEQIHIVFKYLRKIVKYKITNTTKVDLSFFKLVPTTESKAEYIKAWNSNATIIIPKTGELKEFIDEPLIRKLAYNLIVTGKTLVFHTKYDESVSEEYPLFIIAKFVPNVGLKPRIEEINFEFSFNILGLNVEQYLDLLDMYDLFENNKLDGIQIYDDLKRKKLGKKLKTSNLNIPKIPILLERNLLEFLSKLQSIAKKRIPVPLGLSPFQEKIIIENIDKKLSKKDAEKILMNLQKKENKAKYSNFTIEKIDLKGKKIYSKELGTIYGIMPTLQFKDPKEEEKFKNEVLEKPGTSFTLTVHGVSGDPDKLIKEFELFGIDPVNNKFPKFTVDAKLSDTVYEQNFDVIFDYKAEQPTFWYQGYSIKVSLKLIN